MVHRRTYRIFFQRYQYVFQNVTNRVSRLRDDAIF